MDKTEYRLKLDEINRLVEEQDYEGALAIVDDIDWKRVKSVRTLCMVADIYEANGKLQDSMDMLQLARKRSTVGKMILYRQVELSLKMGEYDRAEKYYNKYLETASNDTTKYILKYKIYKAKKAPIKEQIEILEEYKEREYTERWVYELARLYKKAGQQNKCIETCDDLILWFGEGKYVTKAMELKMTYVPLSPEQKAKYDKRDKEHENIKVSLPPQNEPIAGVSAAVMENLKKVSLPQTEQPVSVEEKIEIPESSFQEAAAAVEPEEPKETEEIFNTEIPPVENLNVNTEHLQERLAKSFQEVLSGINRARNVDSFEVLGRTANPETTVKETEEDIEEYHVTSLEPEVINDNVVSAEKGDSITEKTEAPQVEKKVFEKPEDTEIKSVQEVDLDALFAETSTAFVEEIKTAEPEIEEEEAEEEVLTEEILETEETVEEDSKEDVREDNQEDIVEELEKIIEEEGMDEPEVVIEEETVKEEAKASEETEELDILSMALENTLENIETNSEYSHEQQIPSAGDTQAIVIEPEELNKKDETIDVLAEIERQCDEEEKVSIRNYENETPEEKRSRILNDTRPDRLTDEQKRLFSYFAKVPGMDQQILDAINGVYQYANEKTSHRGNIAVMGSQGTGKTRLSEGLVKAICVEFGLKAVKYANIDAIEMNRKDPVEVISKMAGGFLLIERASYMSSETIEKLSDAMEIRTDSMILIIEDQKENMRKLLKTYPEFSKKFETVISIPVFTNDELVTFARTYAKENGYKMDEMGVLALYTLIGDNQREDEPITIANVKDMVDKAIQKASGRQFGRRLSKRHIDADGRILLYEKDFDL